MSLSCPNCWSTSSVVRAVAPRPVNVVVGPASGPVSLAELELIGVKRLSLGGALYRRSLSALRDAAQALAPGDVAAALGGAIPSGELTALLPGQSV